MREMQQQLSILKGARLAFVSIHDDKRPLVVCPPSPRLSYGCANIAPFLRCRPTRPAHSTQIAVLQLAQDRSDPPRGRILNVLQTANSFKNVGSLLRRQLEFYPHRLSRPSQVFIPNGNDLLYRLIIAVPTRVGINYPIG